VPDDLVTGDDMLVFDDERGMLDDLGDDDALMAWLTCPDFGPPLPFQRNQRELHFHIAVRSNDPQRQRDLIQNLERLECIVTTLDEEMVEGYLLYNPHSSNDRKTTAQLHKLLDRWQRKGHLSWTASRKT
jgi:hypothetical protein